MAKVGLEFMEFPTIQTEPQDRGLVRISGLYLAIGTYAFTGTRGTLCAGYHAMAITQDLGYEVGPGTLRLVGL